MQAGIVAIIAATLFLRTHLHPNSIAEGQLYSGFLFFSLLQMFFSGIAEMTFAVSTPVAVSCSYILVGQGKPLWQYTPPCHVCMYTRLLISKVLKSRDLPLHDPSCAVTAV